MSITLPVEFASFGLIHYSPGVASSLRQSQAVYDTDHLT